MCGQRARVEAQSSSLHLGEDLIWTWQSQPRATRPAVVRFIDTVQSEPVPTPVRVRTPGISVFKRRHRRRHPPRCPLQATLGSSALLHALSGGLLLASHQNG